MFVADSLVAIGLATLSLGTIQEADGVVERSFWLHNCGAEPVQLVQGYTSCGCTTISFAKGESVAPGDSTSVTLRFNPRGKGGEFLETGTVVYGSRRKRVQLSLEGSCVTSEETLMRQFPVRVNDSLRLSTDRFDLGIMAIGQTKERNVVVLHRDGPFSPDGSWQGQTRQERILVAFTADTSCGKGLQHIAYPIKVGNLELTITLDVFIK